MQRLLGVLLVLALVSFGQTRKQAAAHADYVPNAKTAERIAEAVLVGQFGDDRVAAQLPLRAASMSNDVWLVEGVVKDKRAELRLGAVLAFGSISMTRVSPSWSA
jgi:hypothetical protein